MNFEERLGHYYGFHGFVACRAEQYAKIIGIWPMGRGKCYCGIVGVGEDVVYCEGSWCACDDDATRSDLFAFEVPFYVFEGDSWADRAIQETSYLTDFATVESRRDLIALRVFHKLGKKFNQLISTTETKWSATAEYPEGEELEAEAQLIIAAANRQLAELRSRRAHVEIRLAKEKS
jgi:hypothetical protein